MTDPLRVTITGAASQIAYPLIFSMAKGDVFGKQQYIVLTLFDVLPKMRVMEGIAMELEDCAFPEIHSVSCTDDYSVAFEDSQIAVLIGSVPRRPGLAQVDLVSMNARIFKEQAENIEKHADRNVKVLVVGNPCCTNAWVCSKYAPSIPKENFTALTRHDQFRAECQIAFKANVPRRNVKNVVIWGNHSGTQFPDVSKASVRMNNQELAVEEALKDDVWLHKTFIETNQIFRVPEQGKMASAMTVSMAIVAHLKDWFLGTPPGRHTSMAVYSDGSYDTPEGVVFSFPVTVQKGMWKIVEDWELDDFSRKWLKASGDELVKERDFAIQHMED